jgi:curved DNA-binding protein CbpA
VARGEGVDPLDPYRTLQVDPAACAEVIEAAFAVLREQVLRDEGPGAPQRLARLNAARRELSDPAARAELDLRRREQGAPPA